MQGAGRPQSGSNGVCVNDVYATSQMRDEGWCERRLSDAVRPAHNDDELVLHERIVKHRLDNVTETRRLFWR